MKNHLRVGMGVEKHIANEKLVQWACFNHRKPIVSNPRRMFRYRAQRVKNEIDREKRGKNVKIREKRCAETITGLLRSNTKIQQVNLIN